MPPAKTKAATTKGLAKKPKREQQEPPEMQHEFIQKKRRQANPVAAVVKSAQSNEAFHTKYVKELQQSYLQVQFLLGVLY